MARIAFFQFAFASAIAASAALAGEQPRFFNLESARRSDTDSQERQTLTNRYNASLREIKARYALYQAKRIGFADVSEGLARFAKLGAELAQTSSQRVHHWEMALDAMRAVESVTEARYERDTESLKSVLRAKAVRFDAEIELVRAQDVAKRDRAAGGE
jgi:hypothetical protein